MTNHWPMKCKIFLLQASQKVNVDVHARNDQHAIKFKASQHAAAHQQGISHQRIKQETSRTKASSLQRAPHDMKNKTISMKNTEAAWQETEKADLDNTKADIKENVARMLDNAGSQAN